MIDETVSGSAPPEPGASASSPAAESVPQAREAALEPAGVPAPETNGSDVRLAELAAQNNDLKDRLIRLQADFENFRKRKAREAEEIRAYASASVLEDLLPVLDHFDLALDPTHDRTAAQWGQGIDLIARQLVEALRGNGLDEVAATPGERFDPAWHEAVAEESANGTPAGAIVRVARKGYRIRERLVRAAQVVVARDAAPPQAAASSPDGANDGGTGA